MEDIGEIEFFEPGALKHNCPISTYEFKYECRNGEFEMIDHENACSGRSGILKCPTSLPFLCTYLSSHHCSQRSCPSLVEFCPTKIEHGPVGNQNDIIKPSNMILIAGLTGLFVAIVIGCVVYIKCFRKTPPSKPKSICKTEIGAPNVYGDNPHITNIPNNMPAPRGFVKSDYPMPPPRVHNVKETSMNAYINDSFQSEIVEEMSSDDFYDEICIGHEKQSDGNISRLTKKEAAAAELIINACHSRGSTVSSTGIYLTTHDNQYDQYNATYMEPRDFPRCGRGVQIQADVEFEVVESSTLTPTSYLPPPPPSLVNSPVYDH